MEKPSSSKKVVCITGCSRGLGRAMVGEFGARGWTVAGCARDARAIADLGTEFAAPHLFRAVDVGDDLQVAKFSDEVEAALGAPDLLLNNAALMNSTRPLWEIGAEEFDALIRVNISGVANCIRHFAPAMITRGSGVMVHFSSGWGRGTSPEVAPYCASKFAIEGLSSALAQDLPQGLASVAFNPGVIDTDMLRSCFGEAAGAHGGADEWAKSAVPFLELLGSGDNGGSLTAP